MQPSRLFTATKTWPNNKYAFVIAGLCIKLILGDGERSNFLQLQKYIRLSSDLDKLSMMVQDNGRNKRFISTKQREINCGEV